MRYSSCLTALLFATLPGAALAQDEAGDAPSPAAASAGGSDQDLAQQLADPVASLISIPFQHNIDCCYGPSETTRYTLNVQPVIPLSLGKDWSLIVRTIVPFISQGSPAPGQKGATDFGDIVQSFFFKPKMEGITLAAGPVVTWPIGGSGFGSGRFGAGPTGLLLKQTPTGLTYGMLANHIWSYAGRDDRRDFSNSLIQPFFTKTFKDSTSIGLNSEAAYDWKNKQWTVPINLTAGHLVKLGSQPMQIQLTGRYYAETPVNGPKWGVRLTTTFLFPR